MITALFTLVAFFAIFGIVTTFSAFHRQRQIDVQEEQEREEYLNSLESRAELRTIFWRG